MIARSPNWVADLYICICIYFSEKRLRRVTVGFYNFREKWLRHDFLTFLIHFNIPFRSDMLSPCIPFKGIEGKRHQSRKPLQYSYVSKEKQLRCENSVYCVNTVVIGMTTSLSPLITLCCSPFSSDVYLVDEISFRLWFQRISSVGKCWYCDTRLRTSMCLMFHTCLLSHLLARALRILRWLTCRILQAFRTFKDDIHTCLIYDALAVIYVCLPYVSTLYLSVRSETGHCWFRSFLLANLLWMLVYKRYIYN